MLQDRLICFILVLITVLAGCAEKSKSAGNLTNNQNDSADSSIRVDVHTSITFHDHSERLSRQLYHNGEDSDYFAILEALGGGVAAIDFDRDGMWDLLFPGGGDLLPEDRIEGRPAGLFRNRGSCRFEDRSNHLPFSNIFTHGAAAADFDDDGFTDVLITGYGAVQLLKNMGDGTFLDVTTNSGIVDPAWSTTAAWGDLDGDGILDVYIANYVDWSFKNNPVCLERPENRRDSCSPRTFKSITDSVFLGLGDGTFRSAQDELGFSPGGKGLGVLIVDLDGDRDLDIYVANDGEPNFIYQNNSGTFSDISVISGADRNDRGLPDGSMGLEAGDFNDDLIPDIWVTNFEKESMALYRSHTDGFFLHVSQPMGIAGIGSEYVGWGISLADFDGDGDEDVFIATGHANRFSKSAPRFQIPILLRNDDNKKYVNVASTAGAYFTKGHLGRGVSGCDFDNDGRCDLAISQMHEQAALLQNTSNRTSNWIGVQLIGRTGTRDPIGARVILTAGKARQTRFVKGGSSYLSTADPRLLFHVPEKKSAVKIEIAWPSGIDQTITDPQFGRYHVILEPISQ